MARKFLISYAYSIYSLDLVREAVEGHGSRVVELEVLPQNDEELEVLRKSLPADEGPIRRILVISPLS